MDIHCQALTRAVDETLRARYPMRTYKAMMRDYREGLENGVPCGRDAGVLAYVNLLVKTLQPHGLDFGAMDELLREYSRVESEGKW